MKQSQFIRRYQKYLSDNTHGYWFKRPLVGWGWAPANWTGLGVTLILIVVLFGGITLLESRSASGIEIVGLIVGWFVVFGVVLKLKGDPESNQIKLRIESNPAYDTINDSEITLYARLFANPYLWLVILVVGIVAGFLLG